ncbi:cell division protein ZapA, partial [gut metagenome]
KIRLTIAGSSYVVWSNDSEEYVQELAERLDNDMAAVMSTSPTISVTASAILSALDYLDELEKILPALIICVPRFRAILRMLQRQSWMLEEARREVERLRQEVQRFEGGK